MSIHTIGAYPYTFTVYLSSSPLFCIHSKQIIVSAMESSMAHLITDLSLSTDSGAPELTFGVEIEGILAFHESRLKPHLPTHTIINKGMSPTDEIHLRSRVYSQLPYRSWSFLEPGNPPENPRGYKFEPLRIAKDILDENNEENQIIVCENKDEDADYAKWQLMKDGSLQALDQEARAALLAAKGIPTPEHGGWDTHGIELVSPPFPASHLAGAQSQISALVSSLKTPTSEITTNNTCGLHVHVGLPNGEKFPIRVLRYLAFWTVIYENHISLLHPPHRYGDYWSDIRSCKAGRLLPEPESSDPRDEMKRIVDDDGGKEKCFESTAKSVASIRDALLPSAEEEAGRGDPYIDLKSWMGETRLQIINWTRVDNEPLFTGPAATVEFRQHDGSLDAVEIGHWVRFCSGLVKLAYKYDEQNWECFPDFRSWSDKLDLRDLLEDMELPLETLLFYEHRYRDALVAGRDAEEGLWEEKWDDETFFEKEMSVGVKL
jgi:hypothetical protein